MKMLTLVSVTALAATLAACGGGDIEIDARNQSSTDNSVGDGSNNTTTDTGGPSTPEQNPCASYEQDGETQQGSYDAPNCVYGTDFVSLANPYTADEDLVFGDLSNDGAHIFNDSLMIGQGYEDDAAMEAAGITQGGDGSVLRLEAGAILAFRSNDDYFVINRGSQIFAEGTAEEPIVVTSTSDIEGEVGPEDVQEWGGMIINGFGITNKCSYTGTMMDGDLATSDCHVAAEGKAGAGQTYYGGENNADNSGVLNYFMVKHTGAQVAPGNDLNGISFNAVGSGTQVDFLQTYSTYDDGIEFFGGAVNVNNYVGLYSRDDTIDIDEAYIGTITNALVIQSETDGDHCIESDGIGSYSGQDQATIDDFVARGLNSRATINNLTCIVSPNVDGQHADGHGWRIREAHFPTIRNSILTTAYMGDQADDNYCVRIESDEGLQAAQDGDLVIEQSIIACATLTNGGPLPDGTTTREFLEASNDVMETAAEGEDPTTASNNNLQILDGFYSLPLGDMVVNGGATGVTPVDADFVGGVTADDDWTAGWTYGLHPDNRAQPLWFESEE